MDIEIVIKGGEELSEFYPKEYEAFQKKIGDMIIEMFPGVGGWWSSSELTNRHQAEKEQREKVKQEHFKQTLINVLKKHPELLGPAIETNPEIQELMNQNQIPAVVK